MTPFEKCRRQVAEAIADSIYKQPGVLDTLESVTRKDMLDAAKSAMEAMAKFRQSFEPPRVRTYSSDPTTVEIQEAVIATLGADRTCYFGAFRRPMATLARGLTAYLSRRMTTASYPSIATSMGRTNHSSVKTTEDQIIERLRARPDAALTTEQAGKMGGQSITTIIMRCRAEVEERRRVARNAAGAASGG